MILMHGGDRGRQKEGEFWLTSLRISLDILLWYMGEVDEVYGIWRNLNHPYIEVDDTAVAIVKFKSGAIGNILVSNSQRPGLLW